MGVVVLQPAFPIPSPPGLMGAAVTQLSRETSPSFPPSIPWLSTPDPKLRTSLPLRAGAPNTNCLTRGHLRDLGGGGRGSRERSYRGKLRAGSRPLGLGQVAGTVAPLPSMSQRARGRGGGKGTHQYWAHTPPGPRHRSDTQPRPPGGHLCSGGERRGGGKKKGTGGSADPHLLRCRMAHG